MEAAPSFLLVDGHSMIFAWEELRALHAVRPAMAREELARRLMAYQDATDERVVLVFDGQTGDLEEIREQGGIQIFYSKTGGSADALIERLAEKYAKTYRLTVASRDRAVLEACSASGALCMGATGLLEQLDAADRSFRETWKRRLK
jgi:predicted RNA-binding protein with PIN domain